MTLLHPQTSAAHLALAAVASAAVMASLSSCDAPFGLGQPTTRALESGVASSLSSAVSFEVTGSYSESGQRWSIDLQVTRPDREHVTASAGNVRIEAIVVGPDAYFRGSQFLSQHMGTDPLSRSLVQAAGNAWWKGSAGIVPRLPDFSDGTIFRTTFLGTAVAQRSDHASAFGRAAVELSGPRASVFVAAAPPYQLLRVVLKKGVLVDGVADADLTYENLGHDFHIAAPTDVIDFSNLSTLPPVYTVVSVDTSGCGSPCMVTALLKNLGGLIGASAPSSVTFTMTDTASGTVLGICQAQVSPDVGYNGTATVGCTITSASGKNVNSATVTAVPVNPGRA